MHFWENEDHGHIKIEEVIKVKRETSGKYSPTVEMASTESKATTLLDPRFKLKPFQDEDETDIVLEK